jgi:metallo-beta-lactamase class B
MTRNLSAFGWMAWSLSVSVSTAAQDAPDSGARSDSARVTEIVARARSAAGAEWTDAVEFLCGGSARPNRPDDPELEPTRVFDNLYALGRTSTVVWAITTPHGIVLIDAGYADQLESVLLPGLRTLGLDPNDVKYVLLGHGHADHFGGASYFQQRGARVVLSAADWDLIENPPAPAPGNASTAPALPPPKRDLVAEDGRPIALGGLVITPVLIPGHTPGALGFVFDVKDGDRTHTAALFGGSILLSARISDDGLEQYLRSIEHFAATTRERRVDVEIQNHPLYDGFSPKLEQLARRKPGDAHPFVVGSSAYQRFLTVMAECTRAELERRRP